MCQALGDIGEQNKNPAHVELEFSLSLPLNPFSVSSSWPPSGHQVPLFLSF